MFTVIPTFHCGGRCAEVISFFLAVTFDTVEEVKRAFDILKEGGEIIEAPHSPDFATCMSDVKDKFGFKWFLMVD
jgi:PhnB protein